MSGAKGRRRAVRALFALSIVVVAVGVAAGLLHTHALSDFVWTLGQHR
jgi:hypothetical protein